MAENRCDQCGPTDGGVVLLPASNGGPHATLCYQCAIALLLCTHPHAERCTTCDGPMAGNEGAFFVNVRSGRATIIRAFGGIDHLQAYVNEMLAQRARLRSAEPAPVIRLVPKDPRDN